MSLAAGGERPPGTAPGQAGPPHAALRARLATAQSSALQPADVALIVADEKVLIVAEQRLASGRQRWILTCLHRYSSGSEPRSAWRRAGSRSKIPIRRLRAIRSARRR